MLSESVSNALLYTQGEEASETAKFALMFDKFFDCFNVSHMNSGKHKRKPFSDPYRSKDDFRLKVCITICHYMARQCICYAIYVNFLSIFMRVYTFTVA